MGNIMGFEMMDLSDRQGTGAQKLWYFELAALMFLTVVLN